MNQAFTQIQGPFQANQDIIALMKETMSFRYIIKLGIQARTAHKCKINGVEVEIGKTGIYELNDVEIDSLSFLQDETDKTIIDCIVE